MFQQGYEAEEKGWMRCASVSSKAFEMRLLLLLGCADVERAEFMQSERRKIESRNSGAFINNMTE